MGLKNNSHHFPIREKRKYGDIPKKPLFQKPTMQIETKFAFPDKVAQIKHMFRDSRGHVVDTPLNRAIMLMTASDPNNYLGTDKNQNQWYIYTVGDNQYWVKTRNGVVMDCGMNNPPIEPDEIFDRKDKK